MDDLLSRLRLEPGADLSLAGQLRHRIALMVADGELQPGAPLPAVRSLARGLGVSVNTVRAAYGRLEADGWVTMRQGARTKVAATLPERSGVAPVGFGSNVVAVIVAGLDPFYLPVLGGVEDVAAQRGMLVLVASAFDSPIRAALVTRRLVARGVDGVIALSMGPPRDVVADSTPGPRPRIPPMVYVDLPGGGEHSLVFDAEGGGYRATKHLIEHGHDRIAMVTPPLEFPNLRPLHDGYARALQEAGLPHPQSLVVEVPDFTLDAGREGLRRLLRLPDRPTAVFAASGLTAVGSLHEARAAGFRIPGDLAVVGYPDVPPAGLVEPALTMVSVPARAAGAEAMATLARLIAGDEVPPEEVVLDVELVVRGSCGPHEPAGGPPV